MHANRVGLGLIGCGGISQHAHMPALSSMSGCAVVAACDPRDKSRATASHHFPEARLYSDYRNLVEDPAVSAVIVAVPPTLNREIALDVLAAGKDLYLEKPVAVRIEDAEVIEAAASAARLERRTISMIGFNFRQSEKVIEARKAITAGEIGEIVSIQTQNAWPGEVRDTWRSAPGTGGGALMDMAVHHIDLALMLSGSRAVSVFAGTRDIHSQEDTVDLTIGLKSGASVQITASYAAGLGVNRLVVTGTKGQLAIDILDPGPLRTVSGKPAFSRIGRLRAHFKSFAPLKVVRQATGEPSFRKALQLFVNACNSRDTNVLPDIGAGLEAMRIAQGAQKSAVCGDRVALSVAGEVSRGA